MKLWKLASVATALVLCTNVNAAIVTHGYLTTDDTGSVIKDTNTGREYLRFDQFDLTYAETVAAISSGGIYNGWSIADSAVADEFYAAALGASVSPCTGVVGTGTTCGSITGFTDGDFGASFVFNGDRFAFTNNVGGTGHGDILSVDDQWQVRDSQYFYSNLSAYDGLDVSSGVPVNFLLYQEVSAVPVPAAVWLFSSGLIGLVGVARRKKA